MPLARQILEHMFTDVKGCRRQTSGVLKTSEVSTLACGVDLLYSYCRVGFLSVSK